MSATHLHLALNHLPVIGLVFSVLVLLVGVVRGVVEIQRLALGLFVLVALAVVPVRMTGEGAEEKAEHLPGVTERVIERHEQAANTASAAAVAVGLFALAGLLVWRRRPAPRWYAGSLLVLGLAAGALMAWTANLGGQVRHTEIRTAAAAGGAELAGDANPLESQDDDDDD